MPQVAARMSKEDTRLHFKLAPPSKYSCRRDKSFDLSPASANRATERSDWSKS